MGYLEFEAAVKVKLAAMGYPCRAWQLECYVNWFWNRYPRPDVVACAEMFVKYVEEQQDRLDLGLS